MKALELDSSFFRFPKYASQVTFEITRKDDGKQKNDYSDYFVNYYFDDDLLLNITAKELIEKTEPHIWSWDQISEFCGFPFTTNNNKNETKNDTGTKNETKNETEAGTKNETKNGTETGTKNETKNETETGSKNETKNGTETGTKNENETGTKNETKNENENKNENETQNENETKNGTETGTKNETKTETTTTYYNNNYSKKKDNSKGTYKALMIFFGVLTGVLALTTIILGCLLSKTSVKTINNVSVG